MKARQTLSFGGRITLQLVLLAGAITAANFAALHAQFNWDASEGRLNSLDPATVEILASVRQPIRILVFASAHSEAADKLLTRFTQACPRLSYELVRITDDPDRVREYGVEGQDGVVILENQDGMRRRLALLREQTLIAAILQLSKGGNKKVLVTQGHGERDFLDAGPEGMSIARWLLSDAGYVVEQEKLTEEALADARVVIIASPTEEFDEQTSHWVNRFVENGGGLLVMLAPPPRAGLAKLLEPYRIQPQPDMVIEINKLFRHPAYSANSVYVRAFHAGHPLGPRMNLPALLRFVRSLAIIKAETEDDPPSPLALCVSSPNSWGETDLSQGRVSWDRGVDPPGPRILVAATGEPPSIAGQGRVMVVGTASFAENRHIGIAGNREFYEASTSWLAGDLDFPLLADRQVQNKLELSDGQLRTLLAVCVVGIPALTGLMGVLVFVQRAR